MTTKGVHMVNILGFIDRHFMELVIVGALTGFVYLSIFPPVPPNERTDRLDAAVTRIYKELP
jgi:hypothetical protein